jgi:hypothetical protein
MGLNDEYSRDAYLPEDVGPESDEEFHDPFEDFSREDLMDWHSEDALDQYMLLREHYESRYLKVPVSFNQFFEYYLDHY